jgi:pimeloyl-ACP methyl ester carboxylesterase
LKCHNDAIFATRSGAGLLCSARLYTPQIAGGISGARFTVVLDCSHLSTIEKPDAVNAALAERLSA